ncbi:probable RNA-dependent RNA polymerase 1 [Centruroides sculpturatus]|uniref:probable RNA-dependent RNA polymerase 1 n=1 Tax=Centruroides sculpturatus TaxID=218467 RepID=UPI000C6E34E1|nr:probable RNA-dependent RNA polymerase 1 [Centruroides sculpturatus]
MRLKFRITSLDNCIRADVKWTLQNLLRQWHFSVIEWVETEKTEKFDDKPTFDEHLIEIQCKSSRFFTDLYSEMDILTTNWCRAYTKCWLTLTTLKCFHPTRIACHENIVLKILNYGTLCSQMQYIIHRHVKGLLSANFYHDLRILEVKHRRNIYDNNNNLLTIKYSSIRKIIVKINRDSALLFLDIKYPPVAFSRGRRVLTFDTVDREVHGKSTVLMLHIEDLEFAKQIVSRLHSCNNVMPIHYGSIQLISRRYLPLPTFNLSNFDCTYNLYAILTRNFVLLEQTRGNWKTFINQIEQQCNENPSYLEKALESILDFQERGVLCHFPHAIELMYRWYCEKDAVYVNDNEYTTPPNTKLIRRVVLTPTRTLFYPSEFQFSNRLLRNFNADYALRVSFRDDDGRKLSAPAAYSDDILEFSVTMPMTLGINIGARHYKFLAWSNSQIRDHGVWMYAEDDNGHNTDTIRTWMGDFSITKSISKYMARLGQCFSHTEDTIKIPLDDRYIITDDDIEGGLNPVTGKPYCFSDGIGKISRQLAENVSEKLNLKKVPCAFQIRYAGYKGMLVVDPMLGDKGLKIVFRKSMKKFDSPSNQLEIVKKSQPILVQLNRPMINILNQLGVPNEVFIELQEEMLSTITDILTDDEKAAEYLVSKLTSKTTGITGFKEMVNAGIGLTGDPFFRELLLCLRERAIYDIKMKARLSISPNEGRTMFGVLDETATLEYGQVFIQYTKDILRQEISIETIIKTGRVLVTKNPCTQPGDIRILEAIDVPALHHIVDCIVFPQKGKRPHPDEMAGSDLDGDEYAVIWKKELFFSHNREPEDFPSPDENKQSSALFNIYRSTEMLKEYIKNDHIGIIANAHLAISDKYGINSPICKKVARKFSLALDYVKTGYIESLTYEEKPQQYPDFMERRTERETYCSERALGDLYRDCEIYEQKTIHVEQESLGLQIDPDLIYPGWEKYKNSALISRRNYNNFLQILMQRYGIQTEIETISGAFRTLHQRYSYRNDASDAEKLVLQYIQTLHKRFKKEFYQEFGISDDTENIDPNIHEEILKKASAWYVITYNSNSTQYLSFPWIVSKYLIDLKAKQDKEKTFQTSIITILEHNLQSIINEFPKLESENKLNLSGCSISPNIIASAYRLIGHWMSRMKEFQPENELWLLEYIPCILQNSYNVREVDDVDLNIKKCNIVNLCLDFLKSIRNNSSLPKNLAWLPSYARDTYNILAATGNLSAFYQIKHHDKLNELVELKPIKLVAKILPGSRDKKIDVLRNILCSLVDLKALTIRSTEKNCLVVSAVGSLKTIKYLENFFRKDTETLKKNLEAERNKLDQLQP